MKIFLQTWWRPLFALLLEGGLLTSMGAAEAIVEIRTSSVRIEFSAEGAVPRRWDIIDPQFIRADRDVLDSGEPGVAVIDASVTNGSVSGPLRVILPGEVEETEFFQTVTFAAELAEDAENFSITFTSPTSPAGRTLTKSYRIAKQGFVAQLELNWRATSEGARMLGSEGRGPGLSMGPGVGLPPQREAGLAGSLYGYVEAAVRTSSSFESLGLSDDEREQSLAPDGAGIRWAGLHDRYFLAAVIGGAADVDRLVSGRVFQPTAGEVLQGEREQPPERTRLEMFTAPQAIPASGPLVQTFGLYFGPKEHSAMEQAGVGLHDVLYNRLWNWLRWLCFALMGMLGWLYSLVPVWGIALILLAVVIRLLLAPVAHFGLRAQARMNAEAARIQPHLDRIKREFKDDAGRRHEESMKVYREHNISPFGAFKGCLWLLLQIPIFVGLFNVIGQAYELRGAEFLWIRDLAEPDHLFSWGWNIPFFGRYFNLLPVLMAVTQVWVSNVSPGTGTEKQQASQRRTMLWMAIAFFVLFYSFPAGLVLYWMCSNLGQFGQQRIMGKFFPMPLPWVEVSGANDTTLENASARLYTDATIREALDDVLGRVVVAAEDPSLGQPVHVMATLARNWPEPLDGPRRADLEAVIRKIEVAKKLWAAYGQPGWKKAESPASLSPVEWELTVATLVAYGAAPAGGPETERGLAVKCMNAACRALDLGRAAGGVMNGQALERWAENRLRTWGRKDAE